MQALHTLLVRDPETGATPSCDTGNEYDGRMGLRISSIFVIMVGSMFGAIFPVFARNLGKSGFPRWAFFVAKYFGSGVIIATAFIHLLAPAEEALTNECLTGPITEYSWAEGIILMTIVVLFFVELMVMRYARFGQGHAHEIDHDHPSDHGLDSPASTVDPKSHLPGEDHLGHSREHPDPESGKKDSIEDYVAQLTSIFILEFGIIFHSVFIGLTLAVSGEEFVTLYIVLVFHQTFEGLGLGSRLAMTLWPRSKRFTPYILGFAYGISTPIAIAIGLGVRKSYPPEGYTTLIVNGVFDSISAGILIYTALVELMAHEFMFSPSMRKAPIQNVLAAFGLLCLGALLMALLGKWA
ncbi:low-affinity Zn(2+) transporter ZRT2 [Aspergillus clavatus NRRL 1]|uniref:Plasma membrane low affinity zinc ion transporter, putative n=1 Tax=Aspergillus clavatus (strain ATCC 1007 / CBS 513.65 / DSM 816 / NCTC 3887 / NRRL 1 / QM 1276 / 107) TaxID=344612 RepID=A1CES4_ASPCL|nr:plasma membrane low affinity zinc ion transporter, putative [Aspergillus clavatus NRRL 1]EAW11373.1 plasma membrane low affinity zinc ion transporter, putative [Aspergillus clavatus NRRL 1]